MWNESTRPLTELIQKTSRKMANSPKDIYVSAPLPEHIAISKSKGIKIDWQDGHRSEYSLAYLRDECPCATCTGAHGTEPQKSNYSSAPKDPFQMYKPVLKMLNVEEIGLYAIKID